MQASLIKKELILTWVTLVTLWLFCYKIQIKHPKNKPSEVNTEVNFMAGPTLASCQRPARASYTTLPFTPM